MFILVIRAPLQIRSLIRSTRHVRRLCLHQQVRRFAEIPILFSANYLWKKEKDKGK